MAADDPFIGLQINHYEVVSLIAEGGMGRVYLAQHPTIARRVAIKFLLPELIRDETVVMRFIDEARATNAIGHPGIIDIIDVGMLMDGRTPYLMMEFLKGESLRARLDRSRPLPIDEAVDIACQTASAVGAAHEQKIVHRDLKPDNLFLVPDRTLAPRARVKVLDFGIAKLCDDGSGQRYRTKTGLIMGTAQFMSPEQCLGETSKIDPRTDIYALGIILYEMLCGRLPFDNAAQGQILVWQVSAAPPPLRELLPDIPEPLERAVMRAMDKAREQRFQSMADFAQAIEPYGRKLEPSGPAVPHAPRVAPTLVVPEGPPPASLDYDRTPTPLRVPAELTPPVALPLAPGPRQATEIDSRPAPSPARRGGSPGVHTTLSRHTGQTLAATDDGASPRHRRGLLIALAVGVAATLALGGAALLRGGPTKPAASAVPAASPEPVPLPDLAPTPAPPSAVAPTQTDTATSTRPDQRDKPKPRPPKPKPRPRPPGELDW
jgi:serine/threonine protein kinase